MIEVKNFSKKINKESILENINFNLETGKIYGFVGKNGSGKSILFKSICGLINITEGNIIINGKSLGEDIKFYDSLGAVLDGAGFLPNLSGFDNLKLLSLIKNKVGNKEIAESISSVGLDPNDKKSYKKYSLGMKQKLAIAQAIMEDPDILILDEPFNALDESSMINVRNILLNLKKHGKTILISSHMKEDIKILCDEVFELSNKSIKKINI